MLRKRHAEGPAIDAPAVTAPAGLLDITDLIERGEAALNSVKEAGARRFDLAKAQIETLRTAVRTVVAEALKYTQVVGFDAKLPDDPLTALNQLLGDERTKPLVDTEAVRTLVEFLNRQMVATSAVEVNLEAASFREHLDEVAGKRGKKGKKEKGDGEKKPRAARRSVDVEDAFSKASDPIAHETLRLIRKLKQTKLDADFREKFSLSVSRSAITSAVNRLITAGLVKREGSTRWAVYSLT